MRSSGKDIIIFLGSGRLFISDGSRVLTFDIPQGAVKDWDMVNKGSLQDALSSFIVANKIEPSAINFILSEPSCFSIDITAKDQASTDLQVEAFLDAVPFNYIVSKTYRMGQGVRIIAGNKELVDAVAEVFEGKGFPLFAVVPAAIFPKVGIKTELDMQFVKVISESAEIIQAGNMIAPKPLAPENVPSTPVITSNKASSGYLPYLIGVGALFVIVLVVLVLTRR